MLIVLYHALDVTGTIKFEVETLAATPLGLGRSRPQTCSLWSSLHHTHSNRMSIQIQLLSLFTIYNQRKLEKQKVETSRLNLLLFPQTPQNESEGIFFSF